MNEEMKYYIECYHMQDFMCVELLSKLQLQSYKRGERLMRAGDELEHILFIVSGKVKTLYMTHNGVCTLHSFLMPSTIIGDVEFFQQHTLINDVIAMEDTICLSLSLRYREEILHDVALIHRLASQLSEKLIRSNHNKSVSLTYSVEKRLAAYVSANAVDHCFYQNQQDAAEMIGCSYRQLQRTLQSFVQRGLLKKQRKGIYELLDEQQLIEIGEDMYVFE